MWDVMPPKMVLLHIREDHPFARDCWQSFEGLMERREEVRLRWSYGNENAKHVEICHFLGQSRINTRSELFGVGEMERGGVGNELHVKI